MKKIILYIFLILLFLNNNTLAKENFFNEAKKKFDKKKFEDSKFLFQRNIVFNPKDSRSYLYLAKIYNKEKNEKEEIKNEQEKIYNDNDKLETLSEDYVVDFEIQELSD